MAKDAQKELWNNLAKKNSRYFIFTDYGRKITEDQFKESGRVDYEKYIKKDKLLKSRGNILEIGSGIGRMTQYMAFDFENVFAVDISGEMISQAKDRLKNLRNVQLAETDGVSLPLRNKQADIVFSYLVFQHSKSKEAVVKTFKEVARVLKPGGIFKALIRTSDDKHPDAWWGGVHFGNREIKLMCAEAGLKLIKAEPMYGGRSWLWMKV